jgi:hypothetical protein
MKIECTLKRKGGTVVELPGKTYHFKEQDDGKHVADVTNEAHIERFLSIPEAYRLLRSPGAEAARGVFDPQGDQGGNEPDFDAPIPLAHAENFLPTYDINGRTYALEEFVERAFADSGLTVEDWNDLPDETRAVKIELVMEGVQDGEIDLPVPETKPVDTPEAEDRAALAARYKEKFGKAPHGKWTADKIKAELAAE